jgi:PAS domain S-box-containing protein
MNTGLSKPRKRAAHADSLFRTAADQAPHVIWIVNASGAVTYLNRAWYELVGGMPPQWYGHDWMRVVAEEDVHVMRRRWGSVRSTGSVFEGTRRVRAQDGTWHTLQFKATPVFDDNGLLCWVGMDSDITELMATQAALQAANRELEAFSYTVSHDLRAPLVTLEGFTKLLSRELDQVLTSRARSYFGRVTNSVKSMHALVEGLLALSQVSDGKLNLGPADLSAIATEAIGDLRGRDPDRRVDTFVEPGLRAFGDARLLSALLANLLGNAWKFTVAADPAKISVRQVSRSFDEIVICVSDNGTGFDMEQARDLFAPFRRLHGSQFPGTGIGLATVSRIAQRHGGRVWVEAAPGEGASFYFALPRRSDSPAT